MGAESARLLRPHTDIINMSTLLADTDVTLTRFSGSFGSVAKSLILLEATPGIEPGYTVLQTVA